MIEGDVVEGGITGEVVSHEEELEVHHVVGDDCEVDQKISMKCDG